jgi:hypothetical protein
MGYLDWLKQFGRISKDPDSAVSATCLSCGEGPLRIQFVADAETRVGYAAMWCEACMQGIHVSRARVPAQVSFLTFEQAADGALPDFLAIEPASEES